MKIQAEKWLNAFLIGISLAIAGVLLSLSSARAAGAPGEADIQAAILTAEQVAVWLADLPSRPASTAVFSIHLSEPLDPGVATLMEAEILKQARNKNLMTVKSCLECRAPQVKAEGDHLIVSKGAPDLESLKALARTAGVDSFITLDVFRTPLSMTTEAVLYQASNGDVISSERFRLPAFELSHASMQFLIVGGPGRTLGSTPSQDDSVPFTINAMALEELGFGKGGLTGGYISAHKAGKMGYIAPTIGFRSRFGATPVSALTSVAAGFGMTGAEGGIATRVAYDVNIGTFTVIGLQAVYLFGLKGVKSSNEDALNGFVGIHLGFSIGR